MKPKTSVPDLVKGVREGQRRSLAKAITLVESQRDDHARAAQDMLQALHERSGNALRLGISGTPGVGKSTFIEALGLRLVEAGHKIAILAVDPSSLRSGGSLLGDKTRMERLSRHPSAFIRPSPSGGYLGGTARRTREAMLLCEAAGFDIVIVETVGVGQSEASVASMVDVFALLLHPGGGDELQGVKRGVLELCDLVCVHKADGDLRKSAQQTRLEYERGLHLLRPGERIPVMMASAITGEGLDRFWQQVQSEHHALQESGRLAHRRQDQAESWLHRVIEDELNRRFFQHPGVANRKASVAESVRSGAEVPTRGALALLDAFFATLPAGNDQTQ